MDTMKERHKFRRTFLNRGVCFGAVAWTVTVDKTLDQKKNPGKMYASGEFGINEEAQQQWIENGKDMQAIYKLQAELGRFIMEMERALYDVDQHNET